MQAAVRASAFGRRGAAGAGAHSLPDLIRPRPRHPEGCDLDPAAGGGLDHATLTIPLQPVRRPRIGPTVPPPPRPAPPALSAVDARPALATIGVPRSALSFGALAVHALGADEAARLSVASWLRDVATMRRVLDGLRRPV